MHHRVVLIHNIDVQIYITCKIWVDLIKSGQNNHRLWFYLE